MFHLEFYEEWSAIGWLKSHRKSLRFENSDFELNQPINAKKRYVGI